MAQLNRASDYGSEGYRFESCRGHFKRDAKQLTINCLAFFLLTCCQIYALFCPTQLLAIFTERHSSPTNIYAFQHQKPTIINIHSGHTLSFQYKNTKLYTENKIQVLNQNHQRNISQRQKKQKRIVAKLANYPSFSCGGRTRTCDLQVMSLASYQLLHSAMLLTRCISFLICECKGKSFLWNSQILDKKNIVLC